MARQNDLGEALERIEETILPDVAAMLESLMEAAQGSRPGLDAEAFAARIRLLAHQMESLTRGLEHIPASQEPAAAQRFASVA